jgi:hypothetical protein
MSGDNMVGQVKDKAGHEHIQEKHRYGSTHLNLGIGSRWVIGFIPRPFYSQEAELEVG